MKSDFDDYEKSSLVMRLERHQNDLRQMKVSLSSYRCEPKTLTFFERVESLKNGLEKLINENREMIQLLSDHTRNVGDSIERVKNQFSEFHMLQQNVEDYIAGVRSY